MRKMKYRRKRPSAPEAHRWIKEGGLRSVSWKTAAEREVEIQGAIEELEGLPKHFPRTQNLEYAVLKSHLIIERAISVYIGCHASADVDVEAMRLSFKQKLDVAYLMGLGANDAFLLPVFELMNKARNQVAHKFTMEEALIDEIIYLASGGDEEIKADNNRQRVSRLRSICVWYCGVIAGLIQGEFYILFGDELFNDEDA